jgi:hypothetical protein
VASPLVDPYGGATDSPARRGSFDLGEGVVEVAENDPRIYVRGEWNVNRVHLYIKDFRSDTNARAFDLTLLDGSGSSSPPVEIKPIVDGQIIPLDTYGYGSGLGFGPAAHYRMIPPGQPMAVARRLNFVPFYKGYQLGGSVTIEKITENELRLRLNGVRYVANTMASDSVPGGEATLSGTIVLQK